MMIAWVLYDITDNLVRNKVAGLCLDYGLTRFQKSVFTGETDEKTIGRLGDRIRVLIEPCPTEKSVLIFTICNNCMDKRVSLGGSPESRLKKCPRLIIIG